MPTSLLRAPAREIEPERLLIGEGAAERLLRVLSDDAVVTKRQTNHFFVPAIASS